MKALFLTLAILSSAFSAFSNDDDHAFYVAILHIDVKEDTLQLSLRVFNDDLETAISEGRESKVFLTPSNPSPQNFVIIRDYITEHLSISSGSADQPINWFGHDFEEDVCWIFGQAILDKDQSILFVKNEVLMSLYKGQHNLIHFKSNGATESKICTIDQPEVRFIIE